MTKLNSASTKDGRTYTVGAVVTEGPKPYRLSPAVENLIGRGTFEDCIVQGFTPSRTCGYLIKLGRPDSSEDEGFSVPIETFRTFEKNGHIAVNAVH